MMGPFQSPCPKQNNKKKNPTDIKRKKWKLKVQISSIVHHIDTNLSGWFSIWIFKCNNDTDRRTQWFLTCWTFCGVFLNFWFSRYFSEDWWISFRHENFISFFAGQSAQQTSRMAGRFRPRSSKKEGASDGQQQQEQRTWRVTWFETSSYNTCPIHQGEE